MLIDKDTLQKVSEKARKSDRLRMNFNLHDSLDSKVQRLFNALEPGTILPIHRHRHTAETYILLSGKLRLMLFDDKKTMVEEHMLSYKDGKYGYHIPKGQWHSLEVLEEGTVIFEVKEGPYAPLSADDILE